MALPYNAPTGPGVHATNAPMGPGSTGRSAQQNTTSTFNHNNGNPGTINNQPGFGNGNNPGFVDPNMRPFTYNPSSQGGNDPLSFLASMFGSGSGAGNQLFAGAAPYFNFGGWSPGRMGGIYNGGQQQGLGRYQPPMMDSWNGGWRGGNNPYSYNLPNSFGPYPMFTDFGQGNPFNYGFNSPWGPGGYNPFMGGGMSGMGGNMEWLMQLFSNFPGMQRNNQPQRPGGNPARMVPQRPVQGGGGVPGAGDGPVVTQPVPGPGRG